RSRWEVSMSGLKGRLSTVVKSKLSKQLDRAENPSETLDYAYQRQVENLQNVKKDQLGAKSVVDDELARLKAEVQPGAPQSALPADDTGTADPAEAQQPADGDGQAPRPVSPPDL